MRTRTVNGANNRPVSLQANEVDVQSALHRPMSLAAVSHICVFHEVMTAWSQKSKYSLKACFENVNKML